MVDSGGARMDPPEGRMIRDQAVALLLREPPPEERGGARGVAERGAYLVVGDELGAEVAGWGGEVALEMPRDEDSAHHSQIKRRRALFPPA